MINLPFEGGGIYCKYVLYVYVYRSRKSISLKPKKEHKAKSENWIKLDNCQVVASCFMLH
jgi:hypothetical protein